MAAAKDAYRQRDFARTVTLCNQLYGGGHARRTDVLLLTGAAYYQLGAWQACVAYNDAAILLDPLLPEAHANLASGLQQLGCLDLALLYFQSAVRLNPAFTSAWNNMATLHVQNGQPEQACECYQVALAVDPALADVRTNLADLLRTQGSVEAAEAQYAEALRARPGYAPAWCGLGDVHRGRADHQQALSCYQQAIQRKPSLADAHSGMGLALRDSKRHEEAEACFRRAVSLAPRCPLSMGNLAGCLYEQGKLKAAVAAYQQAIQLSPALPEYINNLANCLRELGRAEEAVQCYAQCIRLQLGAAATSMQRAQAQKLSVAYTNLGGLLKSLGRLAECVTCYEQVVLLQPNCAEAHCNLAGAHKDGNQHERAVACYCAALALRPDFPEAFANMAHSLQCVVDWAGRDQLFERLEADVRRDLAAGRLPSVQPFHAMGYPLAAELALQISRAYASYCLAAAMRLGVSGQAHPPAAPLAPGQRLRVGYVSSDFGNHPLSHLMGSVFGMHNRSKVEVFCYALTPSDGSEWRQRIEEEADAFLDVSAWPAHQVAQRISQDGVQVLLNLNGYTKGARNEIFALQPAPVQVSYMGFPASCGAPYIPWLVVDKVVCPPSSRHAFSEAVARMPYSYFVNDYRRAHPELLEAVDEEERELEECGASTGFPGAARPTRTELGLPQDAIYYKLSPETFASWMRILGHVPRSVLWLLRWASPTAEDRLRKEAAAAGIDPARLIFSNVAPKPEHIARSRLADLFLDTSPCTAHTVACDVLWSGCPLVTLPQERMASRVAASLCAATGLGSEMVASTRQEYEDMAVDLALNRTKLQSLRRRLRAARDTCPLFDTERWVADFERALLRMWEIHCKGLGPCDFAI
eukprot:scaffold20.g7691.t1